MTAKYASHVAKRGPTKQTQPIPGREKDQVKNNAGGFVFQLGDWDRFDRFLILGSEGNTYYATEKAMTLDNAAVVMRCLAEDGPRAIARIVEISDAGRAPKNDPALFALALGASADDLKTKQAALRALPKVARIGTHLFHFAEMVQAQRGWGRALRRAIGDWYNAQPVERLTNQVSKYQQRDGWSNRDLLRLAHPKTNDPARAAIYNWVCGRKDGDGLPDVLKAFDELTANPHPEAAVEAIRTHGLPRECIPTELLNDVDVWAALLEDMPLHAMVRNLGKMSAIGLLKPLGRDNAKVVEAFGDVEKIRKSRLHPLAILMALATYAQGHGDKGKLSWTAVPQIVDALNDAFYLAFKAVQPTNKRIMLALDVSGSMGVGAIAGSGITPRAASAALALVTANVEPNYFITGFAAAEARRGYYGGYMGNDGIVPLPITPSMRLDTAVQAVTGLPFGRTDCSLPMVYALEKKLEVDAFVIYTDNETYAGGVHPAQALQDYRCKTGINAKLVVCGMTATEFSIADPKDPGMFDVVGFDTATPNIISDFIRG